ncbi:unnamed protein product [Eretmochelys imbricata]
MCKAGGGAKLQHTGPGHAPCWSVSAAPAVCQLSASRAPPLVPFPASAGCELQLPICLTICFEFYEEKEWQVKYQIVNSWLRDSLLHPYKNGKKCKRNVFFREDFSYPLTSTLASMLPT